MTLRYVTFAPTRFSGGDGMDRRGFLGVFFQVRACMAGMTC